MTTQSHLPGLRPALSGLPPTLQPHAVMAIAPPTDRRRSAALAAGVYALLAGGVIWFARAAPAVVNTMPPQDRVVIYQDPGPTQAPPVGPVAPTHPSDPIHLTVTPPTLVDPIPETPTNPFNPTTSFDPPAVLQNPASIGPASEAAGGGPLAISGDAVRVLRQVSPAYPPLAIAARKQGEVVVRMVIDPTGVPVSAEAVSGPQVFFGPAVAAARQWRFSPATQNGQAVPATFLLTLKFILR